MALGMSPIDAIYGDREQAVFQSSNPALFFQVPERGVRVSKSKFGRCDGRHSRGALDHRGHGFAADNRHASTHAPSLVLKAAAWRRSVGMDG